MASAGKQIEFYHEGNEWFCNASLPSDIILVVDGVYFHLHKFPLVSKCGRIAKIINRTQAANEESSITSLEEFLGGTDAFLVVVKFCYGGRVEFTLRNIVMVYCAANYLEMTEEYGDGNLLSLAESFFHKNILHKWKDCILSLQSCEPVISKADKLHIISRCLNALSLMVCTDPSLFGWPLLMYGNLRSPEGSILSNGINTGARIQSTESDWWFEDVSYLCVPLFERLIQTMEVRGIRPETLAGAIMYYCRKYLPGLGRWQGGQTGKTKTVASFSMTPAAIDQKVLLESIVKLLPRKKGRSFCRFFLGLLRVALILGVSNACRETLERRIGIQLDLATLDGLLIPSYSDSDVLYNIDCVEQMIHHFASSEQNFSSISPSSFDLETSPSSGPSRKVAKLVDSYIAEIASDVNLKPGKLCSIAEALPESSRPLHDGLYRAVDIYLKAHPWLREKEKEQLCSVIDFQKLSIDACAHASQNKRLPIRVVLQVLFFEELQLRSAIAGYPRGLDAESAPAAAANAMAVASQILQRDGRMTVVHENRILKGDMRRMRERVGELEAEFRVMKQEMKRVTKPNSFLNRSSNSRADIVESTSHTPRSSVEQAPPSRKSFSLF